MHGASYKMYGASYILYGAADTAVQWRGRGRKGWRWKGEGRLFIFSIRPPSVFLRYVTTLLSLARRHKGAPDEKF